MYNVKLEQFEGPLDLLYDLIQEQKLDITRVSLALVTDQYLEYLNNHKESSLENLAKFLTIASRLILIKSKALLPVLELSEEEEEKIKDLEWQLREYKKFKEVSEKMEALFFSARRIFVREKFIEFGPVFNPPENINVFDLKKTFLSVLEQIPESRLLDEEVVLEIISLEEKITHLCEHIRRRAETSFTLLISQAKDKAEVVVSFLALLEMVKQKIVEVEQSGLFEEIKMKKSSEQKDF